MNCKKPAGLQEINIYRTWSNKALLIYPFIRQISRQIVPFMQRLISKRQSGQEPSNKRDI